MSLSFNVVVVVKICDNLLPLPPPPQFKKKEDWHTHPLTRYQKGTYIVRDES